jgi:hypothetical protein
MSEYPELEKALDDLRDSIKGLKNYGGLALSALTMGLESVKTSFTLAAEALVKAAEQERGK